MIWTVKGAFMKQVNRLWRVFMVCIVFLLAACNLTYSPQATPTVSFPPTQTAIPTSSPTPYPPPEHTIGIRVTNGVGEFYDRTTNEKFIPRGMNYIHLGEQTNPYGESTTY